MIRFVRILTATVFAVALFLILLMNGFDFVASDLNYYRDFQVENDLTTVTGKSQNYLDEVSKDTATYLQNGDRSLMEKHFSENEILHMDDVYQLFVTGRTIRLISILVLLAMLAVAIYRKTLGFLLRDVVYASIGLLLVIAVIAIVSLFNFQRAFVIFHEILFSNDLWLMDTQSDLMIQMMPTPFFVGMFVRILILVAVSWVVLLLAFFFLSRYLIKRREGQKVVG